MPRKEPVMALKIFMYCFWITQLCDKKMEDPELYRKKALWAILQGFAKAGIYIFA
jgi:hypothetical protein